MKKLWQHMNRGLLLLFVAILAVSTYLLIDNAQTKKDKAKIKDISEQFINESSVYFVCPSEPQFWEQGQWTEEALASLMTAATNKMESFFCENEAVRHAQVKYFFPFFDNCRANQLCPVNCTRTPLLIEISEIYNGSATVFVSTQTTVEFIKEDGSRVSQVYTSNETLLFLKQETEWKLVSAEIHLDTTNP